MLIKNNNIIVEQMGEEYILFDSEKNTIYILNQTAYELWIRCENRTRDIVIKDFVALLDAVSIETTGLQTIQNECENMINDFLGKGLIKE